MRLFTSVIHSKIDTQFNTIQERPFYKGLQVFDVVQEFVKVYFME